MLIVFTTVDDPVEGKTLAESIVRAKLAACVQILPEMTSVYNWEGAVHRTSEYLVLIKTIPEKYNELEAFIMANHSYSVPEFIAVEAEHVSQPYLEWLTAFLR